MQEFSLSLRALKMSAIVTVATTFLLYVAGHSPWAFGFLMGALLSQFSLVSLVVIVPFLFQPGAFGVARFLMSVTLVMKLPIYLLVLYIATHVRGIEPAATCIGIGLVPAMLTLKTIGGILTEGRETQSAASKSAMRSEPLSETTHSQRAAAARAAHAELARERG